MDDPRCFMDEEGRIVMVRDVKFAHVTGSSIEVLSEFEEDGAREILGTYTVYPDHATLFAAIS